MRVQRLPATQRKEVAWKNGGGTTAEVAVWPPGVGFDDFDWRVSMARVERDGPFSRFPGIERTLVLLEGRMRLSGIDEAAVDLIPGSPPIVFDGDLAVNATVHSPVLDLNVMCRRDRYQAHIVPGTDMQAITCEHLLLVARNPMTVTCGGHRHALEPDDVLWIRDGEGTSLHASGHAFVHNPMIEIRSSR